VSADELLAADPAFQTVCDERLDRAVAEQMALADLPAPQPWQLAWCGRDDELLDEVTL
jgi:hypothetical protein